jgi:catechol 2,3-dioxygenase-like lactoylglutathione lyase family enzyme
VFQGLRTVIYAVADLEKAKDWYSQVLSQQPYFSEPFYVGFNVGGFELALDPDTSSVKPGNNAVAYWGVSDAKAAYAHLLGLGARENSPIHDVGAGILVGSVLDHSGTSSASSRIRTSS